MIWSFFIFSFFAYSYYQVRVRLRKIDSSNFLRFVVISIIFFLLITPFLTLSPDVISITFFTFVLLDFVYTSLKYLTISAYQDTKSRWQKMLRDYQGQMKVIKKKNGYYLRLGGKPLAIFSFLKKTHGTLKSSIYFFLDKLHKYLPFVPGNHDKINGVPIYFLNNFIAQTQISGQQSKVVVVATGLRMLEHFVQFNFKVSSKKQLNWQNKFEKNLTKNTKIIDLYVRHNSANNSQIEVLVPYSAIQKNNV